MPNVVVKRGFVQFFFFILVTSSVIAQSAEADSLFLQQLTDQTATQYRQMIGRQSRIYNGLQYPGYPYSFVKGHPFFKAEGFRKGTIMYDGIVYNDVQLLYDELSDILIIQLKEQLLQLPAARVALFSIEQNHFIAILKDSLHNKVPGKAAYYEVLFDGKTPLYRQEIKTIFEELTSDQGILRYIQSNTTYYVKKGNDYFAIRNKRALLDVFSGKKKEVKSFIKDNQLNFTNDPEGFLVKIVRYYNQMLHD
jgi:hypothetical protein